MAIHRTKLLAAALLVAGGVMSSGIGSGWLATAEAQAPKPAAANTDAVKILDAARKQLTAQQQQLADRERERIAEFGKLLDAARAQDDATKLAEQLDKLIAEKVQADATERVLRVYRNATEQAGEFHYVPQPVGHAPKQAEFETMIRDMEAKGSHFVGVVTMTWPGRVAGDGKNVKDEALPTLVFRRPNPELHRRLWLDLNGTLPPVEKLRLTQTKPVEKPLPTLTKPVEKPVPSRSPGRSRSPSRPRRPPR